MMGVAVVVVEVDTIIVINIMDHLPIRVDHRLGCYPHQKGYHLLQSEHKTLIIICKKKTHSN